MRSALVLTDFSEAAFRAGQYVCSIADLLQIERIVLYHGYHVIIPPTDVTTVPVKTDEELYLESMESLGLVRDQLQLRSRNDVIIETFAENTLSPETVNERCVEQKIDVIAMGINDKSGIDRMMAGNFTARMLQASRFPLLMIPAEAIVGREIKSIVFATDLKDIETIPVAQLYSFLDACKAEIHVVNAGPDKVKEFLPEDKQEAFNKLHALLDKYSSHFYFVDGDNPVDSILTFAGEHRASLIIAIPKKHGFLFSIFHKSISKTLVYNSRVPLLCLPEVEAGKR